MVDTLAFIEIWLKLLEDNYIVRGGMYNKAMKYMFQQIHLVMSKSLSPKQKVQKLMTGIGGGWYMEKNSKGLPPLRISKLIKKSQEKEDEIFKNYMKLISGVIIGNSNYIGTSLNGKIQEVELKLKNPIQFLQNMFT